MRLMGIGVERRDDDVGFPGDDRIVEGVVARGDEHRLDAQILRDSPRQIHIQANDLALVVDALEGREAGIDGHAKLTALLDTPQRFVLPTAAGTKEQQRQEGQTETSDIFRY